MNQLLFAFIIAVTCFSFIVGQPLAIHQLIVVNTTGQVLVRMRGFDTTKPLLQYVVQSLPQTGQIYQLSQVFSDYGYLPQHGTVISAPKTIITGSQSRFVYKRPANDRATNQRWDVISFTAGNGPLISNPAMITFVPTSGAIVGSDFTLSNENWIIVGNKNATEVAKLETFSRGAQFSNYIVGIDNIINIQNGVDISLWYFQAPPKFYGNFGISYGGQLTFSQVPFSGDMKTKYSGNVALVVLECDTCIGPVTTGIRLVYPLSAVDPTVFNSTPWNFALTLNEHAGWIKDSQNTLSPWLPVSQCDMIQVLSRLSNIRILGDWTPWYESVGLDNVLISNLKGQIPLCAMFNTDASVCKC